MAFTVFVQLCYLNGQILFILGQMNKFYLYLDKWTVITLSGHYEFSLYDLDLDLNIDLTWSTGQSFEFI